MKITVNLDMFVDSFARVNLKNFSRNGLKALFDHLTESEWNSGEEIELDPSGLCCKFEEYLTREEIEEVYGIGIEDLKNKTDVIEFEGGFIVREF